VFTARYGLRSYITQIGLVFKGSMRGQNGKCNFCTSLRNPSARCVCVCVCVCVYIYIYIYSHIIKKYFLTSQRGELLNSVRSTMQRRYLWVFIKLHSKTLKNAYNFISNNFRIFCSMSVKLVMIVSYIL